MWLIMRSGRGSFGIPVGRYMETDGFCRSLWCGFLFLLRCLADQGRDGGLREREFWYSIRY